MASQRAKSARAREFGNVLSVGTPLTDPTTHLAPVTHTGGTDWAECDGLSRHTIEVVNGITNPVIFHFEGCVGDPAVAASWQTISYREKTSDAAYVEANKTVLAGATDVFHFSPLELFRFMRVNVDTANAVGTAFTLNSET